MSAAAAWALRRILERAAQGPTVRCAAAALYGEDVLAGAQQAGWIEPCDASGSAAAPQRRLTHYRLTDAGWVRLAREPKEAP